MIMGVANGPVVVGDELWFYYGGWDGPHRNLTRSGAIGLSALRLDGFASLHAGAQEGWLITRQQTFARPVVTINARVRPGGYLVAELLDEFGNPMPGFDRAHGHPFTGDAVRHRLSWGPRTFDSGRGQRTFAIRFYMCEADLYSYLPH